MYIPKSQIQIKSTNGEEFEIILTGEPYIGDYIETSQGYRYTGTNNFNIGDQLTPILQYSDKESDNTEEIRKFNIIKEDIYNYLIKTKPIPSIKKYPSEDDYINGFFIRYFTKRINGLGYQEIDEEIFNNIKSKTGIYDYNLYEVGNLKWNLKGNVFKDNALTLKETELSFPNISYLFPKFNEFAREPIQNQENLYTVGGELYYEDGTEYIGAYHIHMTNGPMRGAYHTEAEHSKLYYISELPKPDNMSYEEFLTNYPPKLPSRPVLPIRETPVRGTIATIPTGSVDPPYTGESYSCIVSWGPAPPGYIGLTTNIPTDTPDYGNGLVPVGSACVDPGDGTGMYNPNDYGSSYVQACYTQCEGSYIIDSTGGGGVGCKMPWDSNYCEPCTIHDQSACANNYSISSGGSSGGGGSFGGGGGGGSSYGTGQTGDCFIGKTSIIMEDENIKRIDEIKVGDIVKSEINTSNVIGIDIHKEKEYTIYSINNSEAFVTAEHPFKTTTGWKAIDPLETFKIHGIESNVLEIGDILITKEGTEEIKLINQSTQTTDTVYNLRLDNEHVYYANGYLVHNNKSGGAWGLDELNLMQQDDIFGTSTAQTCPCGVFQGAMQYSEACC
jgi:hypothetical protein